MVPQGGYLEALTAMQRTPGISDGGATSAMDQVKLLVAFLRGFNNICLNSGNGARTSARVNLNSPEGDFHIFSGNEA